MQLTIKPILEKMNGKQVGLYVREIFRQAESGKLPYSEFQQLSAKIGNANPKKSWKDADCDNFKEIMQNGVVLDKLEKNCEIAELKALLAEIVRILNFYFGAWLCEVFSEKKSENAVEKKLEEIDKDSERFKKIEFEQYEILAVCEEEILKILEKEDSI